MNIIQTLPSLDKASGGPTFAVANLSLELNKIGNNIFLLSELKKPNHKLYDEFYLSEKKIKKYLLTNKDIFGSLFNSNLIDGLIEKEKIKNSNTIIHINGLWRPLTHAAFIASKKHRINTIISPRGMLEPWAIKNSYWKKKIAWWAYLNKDLINTNVLHATSEKEAKTFRSFGFKQPIAIIDNGVEFKDLNANTKKKSLLIKLLNIENKKKNLLFLSRIHPVKGLINLIEAWDKLRPNDWNVIIAGPDNENHLSQIKKMISQKNISENFKFLGYVNKDEKAALFEIADLFILPTLSENFGVVIAEALSSGTPVITTKAAPWNIINELDFGWWVDTGIMPLYDVLKEALSLSKSDLKLKGNRAKLYSKSMFKWNKIANKMNNVYNWILKNSNKPECII